MKELKRQRIFFEKKEKMYIWQKPEGVKLHDGNFDGNMTEEIQKTFFITLFAKKIQSEKHFDITFSLNRCLREGRKSNETMNPIFGLDHEIYELKYKRTKNFFVKN